jgi:hypothetical protein
MRDDPTYVVFISSSCDAEMLTDHYTRAFGGAPTLVHANSQPAKTDFAKATRITSLAA